MTEVRGAAGGKSPTEAHGLLAKVEGGAANADSLAAEVLSLGEEEGRAALAGLIRSLRDKNALLEVSEALGSQLGLVPLIEKILEERPASCKPTGPQSSWWIANGASFGAK